eukprot:3399323-Amphidinium_carterae.1
MDALVILATQARVANEFDAHKVWRRSTWQTRVAFPSHTPYVFGHMASLKRARHGPMGGLCGVQAVQLEERCTSIASGTLDPVDARLKQSPRMPSAQSDVVTTHQSRAQMLNECGIGRRCYPTSHVQVQTFLPRARQNKNKR